MTFYLNVGRKPKMYASGLLILSALFSVAVSDTPANCTYEDIRGKWTFHLGQSGFDNTIDCSEKLKVVGQLKIELSYPDVAKDEEGNTGFWTLIYNQGFEVVIGGRKYFAFSKYKVSWNHKVASYCNTTSNGWAHDEDGKNWACYYGEKENSSVLTTETLGPVDKLDLDHKYVRDDNFIDEINRKTNLWEAVHYPELEGVTLHDRLRRAGGVPKNGPPRFLKPAPVTREILEAVKDLPEAIDWRNSSGVNYVSPIRNQGSCGSCYAFGSMAMLEARVRLMSNNSMQPVFSTQDIVSCSEYSQKCEGGFPYLIAGKYGEDFGVVEESCLPYTGHDSTSCSKEHSGCKRWRTTKYHYIGGYYGACNEQLMQLELAQNGPIAVSFEVTKDFQAYKKGIYHKVELGDGFNPWEITNHVVAIVGYGVENGVKYWTVKNSWGESWGEDGFFRIIRGTDELSIESMAVAVTPILPSK